MNKNVILTGFADEIASDLTTQMRVIKALDMSYIEMRGVDGNNLIYHPNEKVSEIKSRMDDAGVKLSALGSPLGKIGIGDPFEPHFDAFKRAVEIAHMMDTRNIRMFSFYMPEDKHLQESEGEVFERLGKFVDYAKANDAVLLHENEKGIYGEMASECKKLMDTFYCENFKAVFDFANFVQCHQDTLEAYNLLKDYVAYVHVKDAIWSTGEVVPASLGDGNVGAILKELIGGGYNGFLSLEPHLFDFVGLSSLEKNSETEKNMSNRKLTGEEAFTLAHDSLIKILENM